jgi:hypothetical protein
MRLSKNELARLQLMRLTFAKLFLLKQDSERVGNVLWFGEIDRNVQLLVDGNRKYIPKGKIYRC